MGDDLAGSVNSSAQQAQQAQHTTQQQHTQQQTRPTAQTHTQTHTQTNTIGSVPDFGAAAGRASNASSSVHAGSGIGMPVTSLSSEAAALSEPAHMLAQRGSWVRSPFVLVTFTPTSHLI